jgi:hypothetical protein
MNLDVEQAFQSRRGGIHRPFQPGVLSGDSKVARTADRNVCVTERRSWAGCAGFVNSRNANGRTAAKNQAGVQSRPDPTKNP